MNLTLNYYTEWYWKINLHNLLHFLALRADSHAQYEIRVYAEKMLDIVKAWVPYAYEAFAEHRIHGASLSKTGLGVVKRMIAGEDVTKETSGMSKREWEELMSVLQN
jgi:thymidylate synthase (FAD)